MIICGIDPAINKCGWGIIECNQNYENNVNYLSSGCFISDIKDKNYFNKLQILLHKVQDLIKIYNPKKIIMEQNFLNSNPKTSLQLSATRGAIIGLFLMSNIDVIEILPSVVKKNITGSGNADKDQVLYMINQLLKINITQLDESDAIACALSECFQTKYV